VRIKGEKTQISPKKRSPRNAKNKHNKRECPVVVGNEYEIEITKIIPNGEGCALIQGFSIFVPNVKVGDKVKVKVTNLDSVSADAQVISRA
jgi:predicted RNA-binding protein with TRAM domain